MFRIKTDIRQYKCETHEKVEKLIRNWVIRPNDLIYHRDHKAWRPIGEHPAFLKLFALLDEHERAEPDTVVTTQSAVRRSRDGGAALAELSRSPVEEVTQMAARPGCFESSEGSVRGSSTAPEPPEAPAGIEAPVHDEVTVMTGKTLDRLRVDDAAAATPALQTSDDAPTQGEADGPAVEVPADDEITGVRAQPDADRAQSEPPMAEAADEEQTEIRSRPEGIEAEASAANAPRAAILKPQKLGRHDLPEEFFATNEISSPITRESVMAIDELGELSEPSESDEEASGRARWNIQLGTPPSDATDDDPTIDASADTAADTTAEKAVEESGDISTDFDPAFRPDSGGDHVAPAGQGLQESSDLRSTQPISEPTDSEDPAAVTGISSDLVPETDELDADPQAPESPESEAASTDAAGDAAEEEEGLLEVELLEEEDEDEDEDRALLEEDSLTQAEQDDANFAESLDEIDAVAAGSEPDEDEELEEIDLDAATTSQLADFISEGYKLPLPFEITPSKENIAAGLLRSTASKALKDHNYPYPVPKKLRALELRNFDLDPAPLQDQSVALMVVVASLVLVAVIGLAMC